MSELRKNNLTIFIQTFQLVTLIAGVAGLFLSVGRRDAILDQNVAEVSDIKDIVSDLTKWSVEHSIADREQEVRLDNLRERIANLERNR